MKTNFLNFLFVASLLMVASIASAQTTKTDVDKPLQHAAVVSPNLPPYVVFCGDTIRFDRYDLRERLDRELTSFCYTHATSLMIFKRANRIFPEVEPILKENGVPDDFKYLMVIESNLIATSRSGVGAAGYWQFMEATAKEYGLVVNSTVDERYNTAKATAAACKYLKDAKKVCGKWISAAASYNAGQQRISASLKNQGETSATDLWLNTETSRYIFRILAIKIIMENPRAYGFHLKKEQLYQPFEYETYTVNSSISDLVAWAKEHNTSYFVLKDNNLWLRSTKLDNSSGRSYVIRIPTKASQYYKPAKVKVHSQKWIGH
ncbi:MAG: lytic transglycosylase domain-containing protein [Bacteroidales bacterium]|nr:lytic transglycosylase domain-containing protein [Bacteroidales bacterium]